MTYAVGERARPGPAGTQEAAQTVGGESGIGRIPAALLFDQFGPVYLGPRLGGRASDRVQSDPPVSLAVDVQLTPPGLANGSAASFGEWWEI